MGIEVFAAKDDGWHSLVDGHVIGDAPATIQRHMGVYTPSNNSALDTYVSSWDTKPNVYSFYLNWAHHDVTTAMQTYAARPGAIIQTELQTDKTVSWADIAAGTYDEDVLIPFIQNFDALGCPVRIGLDNEPSIRWTATSGPGAGSILPDQTPAQYCSALEHMSDLMHANATNVKSLLWMAYYGSYDDLAPWFPDPTKIDYGGWDKYDNGQHGPNPSALSLWEPWVNDYLIPVGWEDVPRMVCETGIVVDTNYSSAQQIDYWQTVPTAVADLNIDSVIFFRSNSGGVDYVPTDSAVDDAFAAVVADVIGGTA